MDRAYGLDRDEDYRDDHFVETPPLFGSADRRLTVRAYDHWVALLNGRPWPTLSDLHLASLADFEPRSVLLDFRDGLANPRLVHLGSTLRDESGATLYIKSIADVPRRSLLSRLTDHYLEILGTRAPCGFEAEFTNHRGLPTLYRGILMPFSSTGDTIDHVFGVINWKHALAETVADDLEREVSDALLRRKPGSRPPVW